VGGLGTVLNALTYMQAERGAEVNVLMPYYSFLEEGEEGEGEGKGKGKGEKRGRWGGAERVGEVEMSFRVEPSMLPWSPIDRWDPWGAIRSFFGADLHSLISLSSSIYLHRLGDINIYLVAPGDQYPFSLVFKASNRLSIYRTHPNFSWDLRDSFFSLVVAQFLKEEFHRNPFDLVQLHGATNALVIPALREFPSFRFGNPSAPSIIYTFHDYNEEFGLAIDTRLVERFRPYPFTSETSHHMNWDHLAFLSSLAIRGSDIVTCVSSRLPSILLSGDISFVGINLNFLDLLEYGKEGRFFGIGNGLDLNFLNPFSNPQLASAGLNFQMGQIHRTKFASKNHLVELNFLSPNEAARPLFLFVGRFLNSKGKPIFFFLCWNLNEFIKPS